MQNICTVLHCRRSRCMPLNGKGIGIIKLLFYFRGRSIQVSIGVELYCEISRRCFCTESALLYFLLLLFRSHSVILFFSFSLNHSRITFSRLPLFCFFLGHLCTPLFSSSLNYSRITFLCYSHFPFPFNYSRNPFPIASLTITREHFSLIVI